MGFGQFLNKIGDAAESVLDKGVSVVNSLDPGGIREVSTGLGSGLDNVGEGFGNISQGIGNFISSPSSLLLVGGVVVAIMVLK